MSCFPSTKKKLKNKPRLTLALYHRSKRPGCYHYALLLTPKPTDPPTSTRGHPSNPTLVPKFHAVNTPFRDELTGEMSRNWLVQRGQVNDIETEPFLHVLVTVGKVCCDVGALEGVLRDVVQDCDLEKGEEKLDCKIWARGAFERLRAEGLLTGKSNATGKAVSWDELEDEAEAFAQQMMGVERAEVGWMGDEGTPCWDILDGRIIAMT